VWNEYWRPTEFSTPSDPKKGTMGERNVYIYNPYISTFVDILPGYHGDHWYPNGAQSGASFPMPDHRLENPNFREYERNFVSNNYPKTGEWACNEIMIQANTIAEDGIIQRDGRIAVWVDGVIVMDFPNLVLRYTEELKLNYTRIGLINFPNVDGTPLHKLVTNVLRATDYIGPYYDPDAYVPEPEDNSFSPNEYYQVGDEFTMGKHETEFDGVLDVVWTVMDKDSSGVITAMSKYAFPPMQFHTSASSPIYWTDSSLCNYLNTTFANTVFNATERGYLKVYGATESKPGSRDGTGTTKITLMAATDVTSCEAVRWFPGCTGTTNSDWPPRAAQPIENIRATPVNYWSRTPEGSGGDGYRAYIIQGGDNKGFPGRIRNNSGEYYRQGKSENHSPA